MHPYVIDLLAKQGVTKLARTWKVPASQVSLMFFLSSYRQSQILRHAQEKIA